MKKLIYTLTLLCFGLLAQAQIPSYVPTNGLVGWWPFNGNANDESGNGNHGTVNGATLAADRFGNAGKAYSFDGVNCCGTPDPIQEVVINNQILNLGTNYTISIWFKSTNINKFQQVLFNSINHTGFAVALNNEHVPNKLSYGIGPSNAFWDLIYGQGTNTNFSNNTWYHVTFIKAGTSFSMFLNTVYDGGSTVINAANYNQNVGIRIGSIGGGHEVFKGNLDDIAIYNRALTAAEVQQLYSGQSACNLSVSLSASDTLAACGTPPTLNAGNAGATYAWNTGDSSQTITANTTGWYSVTVSQNGCSATDSVYVNLLKVDLGNDTTVCRNSAVEIGIKNFQFNDSILIDQFTMNFNSYYSHFSPQLNRNKRYLLVVNGRYGYADGWQHNDPAWNYAWDTTRGIKVFCNGTQTPSGSIVWLLDGKTDFQRPINDQFNSQFCQGINKPFYWELIGKNNPIHFEFSDCCYGDNSGSLNFSILERSIPLSTLWSTGDTTPSITVTPSQTTTYYCTVSDGISTCTDSVTVFVTAPPVLSLPDTLRSNTRPVVLQPGAAAQYAWSTGDTTSSLSVNTAGTYSVTAANAAGCSASDTCLVLFSNPAPAVATPAGGRFNYQASVMDLLGKPMANRTLAVRFSISDSSSTNYVETQSVTTDARGHFATQVGAGTVAAGSLDNISWWDGLSRALRTEIDTTGSGSWMQLGSSSLVAVPFSMYALRSGDGSRSVYGSFDANGTVVSGRGFSVTPLGNGRFEIEFQQEFNEIPTSFFSSNEPLYNGPKMIQLTKKKCIAEVYLSTHQQISFEMKGR